MNEVPPSAQLMQLIFGYTTTQMISVAAKLQLADMLIDGPKSIDELASATGMQARPLHRILRTLASVGIFAEEAGQRFGLTPMAELLRSDGTESLRNFAIVSGSEMQWNVWGDLAYTVQSGKPNFERLYGKPYFDHLADNPVLAKEFNDAMTNFSASVGQAVLDAYDFSGITKLVDVGGGHGSLLASILTKYPQMQGVLFDAPSVVDGATKIIDDLGVSSRCTLVGGDFFVSVPSDCDGYVMQHIIHDWDDDQAVRILRNCREAMTDNGKLLVIEMVIPNDNSPSLAKFLDLGMMMFLHGGERTDGEYHDLFEKAGLRITKIFPTRSLHSVIEAVRQ